MQESFKNKYSIYADYPECAPQIKKINEMFEKKDLVHISQEISKLDDIVKKIKKEPEKKVVEIEIEEEYPVPGKNKSAVITGGEDKGNYYLIFIILVLVFVLYEIGRAGFSVEKKDYNVFLNNI